jgi:hypothetical protein
MLSTVVDFQIRHAAFDHVDRLATSAGGILNSDHLADGFLFRGERVLSMK